MLAERSDPSLSLENLDFVVCTLARLCPLIARVWTDIPMIIYSSMPIMFSSPSPAHDQILLRQLRDLVEEKFPQENFSTAIFDHFSSKFVAKSKILFQFF